MAMANRRDGGRVIIGVEDTGTSLIPTGLTPDELSTWRFDHVGDSLASYADPPVAFEIEILEYTNASFVIITVAEFEEIPVLCKRDYQGVLRDGACYVRSWRKPESVEVPSHSEMRDLLDLAADKQVRRFYRRATAAGLLQPAPTEQSSTELYDAELPEELK